MPSSLNPQTTTTNRRALLALLAGDLNARTAQRRIFAGELQREKTLAEFITPGAAIR